MGYTFTNTGYLKKHMRKQPGNPDIAVNLMHKQHISWLSLYFPLQNTIFALKRCICNSSRWLGILIIAPNTIYNAEIRKSNRMQYLVLNMHVQVMLNLICWHYRLNYLAVKKRRLRCIVHPSLAINLSCWFIRTRLPGFGYFQEFVCHLTITTRIHYIVLFHIVIGHPISQQRWFVFQHRKTIQDASISMDHQTGSNPSSQFCLQRRFINCVMVKSTCCHAI